MSKWSSDAKQRRSRKYQSLHAQLVKDVRENKRPALLDKRSRKVARSEQFRLVGTE